MTDQRLTIPAELQRRVLIEAGHRCAIPTCRYIEVEIHHIVPWEQCHKHVYENLIALCPNCHWRANAGKIDRKSLLIYKANLRFAHDKFSQFEIDVLFELHKLPPGQPVQWPPFLRLLIKRLLDADYVSIHLSRHGTVSIIGMDISPVDMVLTDKGRKFIDSLGDEIPSYFCAA